jgi:methylmalonyl-CoA mutase C-terminal domain/subunit
MKRIPRVVVAKVGLDGHDRGAKVVARALRDAGFEVIYTGLRRTPEEVVEIALQEDADVIAVSILSGAHMTLIPRILNLLKERNAEDILVIAGGTIPEDDAEALKQMGVRGVYPPGTLIEEFVQDLRRMLGLPELRLRHLVRKERRVAQVCATF